MPQLVAPGAICGGLGESVAGLTGLKAGTPVVAGAGDGQAMGLGMGVPFLMSSSPSGSALAVLVTRRPVSRWTKKPCTSTSAAASSSACDWCSASQRTA
uniref:hypothetical protein n=1 Tax=Mesorhizobium sp. L-2-11 TaxID=2744521 RepID=UPI001FD428B0|nr:hypothetical protein [Mesorhizobium sp. L-2-11]